MKFFGELIDTFGEERAASYSREISKLHEETLRGTLAELQQQLSEGKVEGEFVVCVAGVG